MKYLLASKVVRYLKVPNGANLTRREIDFLTEEARKNHGDGLAFLKYQNDKLTGSISKFFEVDEAKKDYDLKKMI